MGRLPIPESTPLQLAELDVPERWYEPSRNHVIAAVGAMALGYGHMYFGPDVSLWLESTTGVAASILGITADRYSTIKMIDALEAAHSAGISHGYSEGNKLLNNGNPSKDDLMKNKWGWAGDGMMTLVSALGWVIAVPHATIRCMATMSNIRKVKRIHKAIEISASSAS